MPDETPTERRARMDAMQKARMDERAGKRVKDDSKVDPEIKPLLDSLELIVISVDRSRASQLQAMDELGSKLDRIAAAVEQLASSAADIAAMMTDNQVGERRRR